MLARLLRRFGAARGKGAVPPAGPAAAPSMPEAAKRAFDEGLAQFQNGEYGPAATAFARALACKHDLAEAHFFMGLIHRKRGELEDAADCLLLATTFRADFADAWYYLGLVDLARGRPVEARNGFDAVLRVNPGHADAHAACAKLCEEQEQFAAAIAHWKAVTDAVPDHALAWCNLGRLTLRESLDDKRAMDFVQQALALQPQLAEAHSCLAQLLQYQGRSRAAIEACDIALRLDPDAFHTRMIRALALLSVGEFEAGWRDYEERKRVYPIYAVRRFAHPEWDGGPLAGRRILVCNEQGLGDEIMFASCLPDLLRQGGECVVECSAKLQPLFARSFPAARVIVADQTSPDLSYLDAAPPCDCRIAAGSLPRHFRRTATDFPGAAGYLAAAPEAVASWRSRLRQAGEGLQIGISWRGGVSYTNQANRSVELAELAPLLRMPGCHFVSLQYAVGAGELERLHEQQGVQLRCWPDAIASLDETAALAGALDMIISVDTTVAHLGGALGRPTWVMLPPNAEWRYMADGGRMPWYPGMRLFRRAHGQGWGPVIEQIRARLAARNL